MSEFQERTSHERGFPDRAFPDRGSQDRAFQDRTLTCVDCGADFIFTSGEQSFFHEKNFKNEPKRCRACKQKRQGAAASGHGSRVETSTSCSHCGRETTVPFRPTQGRPVFCRECFQNRKEVPAAAASA